MVINIIGRGPPSTADNYLKIGYVVIRVSII